MIRSQPSCQKPSPLFIYKQPPYQNSTANLIISSPPSIASRNSRARAIGMSGFIFANEAARIKF